MASMGLMRVGRRTARAAAAVAGKRSAASAIAVAVSDRQLFHSTRDAATPTFINRNARCQSTQATTNSDAGASANAETEESTDPEARILKTALAHVPELGWTIEALAAGATDLGYPSVAHGMFPRGAIELVDHFMDLCLAQTRQTLIVNTEKLQGMAVADRLKFGVRARLELLAPFMSQWPQAMALGAQPPNTPTTMKKLANLSDEIWYFAGDKSTDASWYTKRAILTGIYASTELFMLSDKSPDFQDTWTFLDRRVDETIQLGELPQNVRLVASWRLGYQSLGSYPCD
ncbi:hypothetical protein BBJ28_00008584 [Nothophytophthora sp. Chile5]|nr:hypothetical protein BBJ28_00008584 [Nothophytophthora sp. Chile5]